MLPEPDAGAFAHSMNRLRKRTRADIAAHGADHVIRRVLADGSVAAMLALIEVLDLDPNKVDLRPDLIKAGLRGQDPSGAKLAAWKKHARALLQKLLKPSEGTALQ